MKTIIEKRVEEINRGIYSFREVGDIKTKKEIEKILLENYKDGSITNMALKSLIDYYVDQIIIFKRIKVDDIEIKSIRNMVLEKINNN